MKVMILAAGLGKRMWPLTDYTPKPLLPVQGKPLLAHLMDRLQAAGCDEIVINVSHLSEQIEAFLADVKYEGIKVSLSHEYEPLETAGGIVNALPMLGDEPFLLINSDVWIDYPLEHLIQKAKTSESSLSAHLILVENPEHNSKGDFKLPKVNDAAEALLSNQSGESLTYSGVGVYGPGLFKNIEPGKRALGPLLKAWVDQEKVTGEKFSGLWLDVGTPARLQQLDDLLGTSV